MLEYERSMARSRSDRREIRTTSFVAVFWRKSTAGKRENKISGRYITEFKRQRYGTCDFRSRITSRKIDQRNFNIFFHLNLPMCFHYLSLPNRVFELRISVTEILISTNVLNFVFFFFSVHLLIFVTQIDESSISRIAFTLLLLFNVSRFICYRSIILEIIRVFHWGHWSKRNGIIL